MLRAYGDLSASQSSRVRYGTYCVQMRLGHAINPGVSAEMQNILKTGDIYAASKDPDGAYIMGSELAYYPEYFEPAGILFTAIR